MLEITYELIGTGWATSCIESDNKSVTITASYLDDALDSLFSACLELVNNASYAHASFTEEPGEYRWVFNTKGEEEIEVFILEFDDLWNHLPDSDGKIIFSFRCALKDLVKTIVKTSTDLLDEYGEEGYKEKWVEHDFPIEKYLLLKAWLGDK